MFKVFLLVFAILNISCASKYPRHWWGPVPKKELAWWEIGPSAANSGEVVLSKRNELGLLSNFADTPFKFYGKRYPNLEAFWQSMKYPESEKDERIFLEKWPYSRAEVERMSAFKAKEAGDLATKIMKKHHINYITFNGRKMKYWKSGKGEHFHLIRYAMLEKFLQNSKVQEVLKKTKGLKLIPDHKTDPNSPPAWKYNEIWMDIRDSIKF